MVSISEQNPEIIRKTDGKTPSVPTSAPARKENNAGIFRIGLTVEKAQIEGLTDLFTKYDKDNNGIIDAIEIQKYENDKRNERDTHSFSGLTRAAICPKELTSAIKEGLNKSVGDLTTVGQTLNRVAKASNVLTPTISQEANASQETTQNIVQEANNNTSSIDNAATTIDQNIENDLDETNENSLINQLYNRYKNKEYNDDERAYYEKLGVDIDNLSDEETKDLAKNAILLKYTVALLDPILTAVENNDADSFAKSAQILMKTKCNTADLANIIMAMAHAAGKSFSEDQIRSMCNTYAETYQHEEGIDEELETIAQTDVMMYADQEYIEILYKNNTQIVDKLNEIAKNVANNTTDETRKSMLNDVVKNSAEITKNTPSQSDTTGQKTTNNTSIEQQQVSNPIQNSTQINYINNLKQAAMEFQAQYNQENVIPENLQNSFTTIQEYRDFTGSGMTLLEYQKTKSALKNSFTTIVDDIVKSYSTIPDKFKTKVLTLFDTLDNNMRGELFLSGSNDVRTFMNKYGYMNNEKLLNYVERHPADLKDAPLNVQRLVRDIREEEIA